MCKGDRLWPQSLGFDINDCMQEGEGRKVYILISHFPIWKTLCYITKYSMLVVSSCHMNWICDNVKFYQNYSIML